MLGMPLSVIRKDNISRIDNRLDAGRVKIRDPQIQEKIETSIITWFRWAAIIYDNGDLTYVECLISLLAVHCLEADRRSNTGLKC